MQNNIEKILKLKFSLFLEFEIPHYRKYIRLFTEKHLLNNNFSFCVFSKSHTRWLKDTGPVSPIGKSGTK
jgi:hypothetical protein